MYNLLNGVIFNYLQWLLIHISKAGHYSMLNILETIEDGHEVTTNQ